jgi:TnpA family transposase
VHQALNELGRVDRTVHILRTIDEEEYRRRQGRELNKGEAAHDLSRFLFFGKQGELRGRSFDDQLRSFSCLGVLHNAVVAWTIIRVGRLVEQLRAVARPCATQCPELSSWVTTPGTRREQLQQAPLQ